MTDPAAPRRGRLLAEAAVAGAVYLALALAVTSSAWADPRRFGLGSQGDPDWTGTAWTWWWTARALAEGRDPAACDLVFHPVGFWAVSQFNIVDALLAAPFELLLGPVAGMNAATALFVLLAAAAAHAVARAEGAGPGGALAAGLVLGTSNYVLGEIARGRHSQGLVVFVVGALGLWMPLLRGRGGWRLAAAAGLVTALAFLEYWYYGFFVVLAVAVAAPFAAVPTGGLRDRSRWLRAAAALGLTGLLVSPFVAMLVGGGATLPGVEFSAGWPDYGELTADDPSLGWALRSGQWPAWPLAAGGGPGWNLTFGRLALLAFVAPLAARVPGRGPWLAVAATGWVLALGPYPLDAHGGVAAMLPLPFLWLHRTVPFFDRLWWPYRAAVLTHVAVAVVVGIHLSDLAREVSARRATALALAVAGALGVEGLLRSPHAPLRATPTMEVSSVYDELDGALVTLPVFSSDPQSRHALWMQVHHGLPILQGLGGHIDGHRPPAIDAFVESNGLLRALRDLERTGGDDPVRIEPADVDELLRVGFRWVVLDRAVYSKPRWRLVERSLRPLLEAVFGPPEHDRDGVAAWRIRVPERAVEVAGLPSARDLDITPRER